MRSSRCEMCRELIAWDLDDTILYNVFNINYAYYVTKYDLKTLNHFCRLNPIINRSDVKLILTARLPQSRDVTIEQLKRHKLNASIIMYPHNEWSSDGMLKFKSEALNQIGADYYVDDDIVFGKELQKHTSADCITTMDYYKEKNNILTRDSRCNNVSCFD